MQSKQWLIKVSCRGPGSNLWRSVRHRFGVNKLIHELVRLKFNVFLLTFSLLTTEIKSKIKYVNRLIIKENRFLFRHFHNMPTFNFHYIIFTISVSYRLVFRLYRGPCSHMLCGVPIICGYIQTKSRVIRHTGLPTPFRRAFQKLGLTRNRSHNGIIAVRPFKGKQKKTDQAQRYSR